MSQIRDIVINGEDVLKSALISKFGLIDYAYIIQHCADADFSKDQEYQARFNQFYKIRWGKEWRENFYKVFSEKRNLAFLKGEMCSFEEVLNEISIDNRVAASYASKMLATIEPDMPIWDDHVLKRLGLFLEGRDKKEKLIHAKEVYEEIVSWYLVYMDTMEAKNNIAIFDCTFPDYKWISDVKKIDYMLWAE